MFCPIDSDVYVGSGSDDDAIVAAVLIVVILGAICVVLWKVFVTNRIIPHGNVLSLGLDESSATEGELYGHKFPWRSLFMHAAVGVTTFEFGVYVYETFRKIPDSISTLNLY